MPHSRNLESVQDLRRLRDEAVAARKMRLKTGTTITIGMGTCGIAAGARETMAAIEQELARHQIQATLSTVGCIGMCVQEPLLDIQQAGGPRVVYANIMADMVPRLIEEHLIKGKPVREWVVCRMPAE